jgi:hypothetical protein
VPSPIGPSDPPPPPPPPVETATPEPGTYGLMFAGISLLAFPRLRRMQRLYPGRQSN